MSFPLLREATQTRNRVIRCVVFLPSQLSSRCSSSRDTQTPRIRPNLLKSKAKQNQSREARIKLYERTLRKHLASDSYPLIDLEVSLDQWKSAAQLIEGMDRAGVALGAVTAASEEAIKKAVAAISRPIDSAHHARRSKRLDAARERLSFEHQTTTRWRRTRYRQDHVAAGVLAIRPR